MTGVCDGPEMHASIWRFSGDPDRLVDAYEALTAELPADVMRLHLALRAPDGLLIVDTCPTRADFEAFANGPDFRAARARHGLPEPTTVEDHPVVAAFVDGARVAAEARR
jgi:hypothetical protein